MVAAADSAAAAPDLTGAGAYTGGTVDLVWAANLSEQWMRFAIDPARTVFINLSLSYPG